MEDTTVWVYVNTCEVWTMELRHLRYFAAVAACVAGINNSQMEAFVP